MIAIVSKVWKWYTQEIRLTNFPGPKVREIRRILTQNFVKLLLSLSWGLVTIWSYTWIINSFSFQFDY